MSVFAPLPRFSKLPDCCALRWLALAISCSLLSGGCASRPASNDNMQARAAASEQANSSARPSIVCSPLQGNPFALRKKVLVLALPVQRPIEAVDLPGLSTAWSHALQQRMQGTDRFLMRDGSKHYIDPSDNLRKQVISLAQMFDVQIVIAGQIDSLGIQPGRLGLGPLGSVPQPFGDLRVIETGLDIYDGKSGARLKHLSHHTEVRGSVENTSRSTLRGDFFHSPLGDAIAGMLDTQLEDIQDELACLPLQARIVRNQKQEVQIDAGFTSNIKPGDRLRVLQNEGFPNGENGEGSQIEKTVGHLVVTQVFPESAVGHIEGKEAPDWRLNGFVRAW